MTDASATATGTAPDQATRPYSPGPRRRHRRRDEPQPRRWRARAAPVSRLSHRRPRRARQLSRGRQPAVDRRVGSDPPTADGTDPARRPGRPARAPRHDEADGRPAHRGLGVGRHPGPALAADDRASARAHVVLPLRAGGVRPAARRRPADRSRPVARPRRGLPVPADRRPARCRDGTRARRLLRRRGGAQLQRLDVHREGGHLDPVGHRVGGRGGHRHDEGTAPRRGAIGGRRPAQPGRFRGARRGVGPRRPRPRGAADGLRPPGLPRLRPAGGGAADGRRGDGAPPGLARARHHRSRMSPFACWPRSTRNGRSRPTSSSTRRRS